MAHLKNSKIALGANATQPVINKQVFEDAPILTTKRNCFNTSHNIKTTMDAGEVVPISWQEILPGETITQSVAAIIRALTPLAPVMDNSYIDIYTFYARNEILLPATHRSDETGKADIYSGADYNGYSNWRKFIGENLADIWDNNQNYEATLPMLNIHNGNDIGFKNLLNYLGVPRGKYNLKNGDETYINTLPMNAYITIWNEWFRNQNFEPMKKLIMTELNTTYTLNLDGSLPGLENTGGKCLKAYKYADYFTEALPGTQKGQVGSLLNLGLLPVMTANGIADDRTSDNATPLAWTRGTDGKIAEDGGMIGTIGNQQAGWGATYGNQGQISANLELRPRNLFANTAQLNINDLRLAFQTQKLLEKLARGGTRYNEIILAEFGIIEHFDQTKPELLHHWRHQITNQQVANTTGTETQPQGNLTAYTHTICPQNGEFTKSFTEHGILMTVAVIRQEHTYSYGLERKFTRKTKLDFYSPVFQAIGEQPIYNYELYYDTQLQDLKNNDVFGYKPAWQEYRVSLNKATGLFNKPDGTGYLDAWTYIDNYENRPQLNAEFLQETDEYIGRTQFGFGDKDTTPQFWLDIAIIQTSTKPLPIAGVPGLIDHF